MIISGPNADLVRVTVNLVNPAEVTEDNLDGFVETDGCVSIEAEHFTAKTDTGAARWDRIEDYGKTLSAMTIFPGLRRAFIRRRVHPVCSIGCICLIPVRWMFMR